MKYKKPITAATSAGAHKIGDRYIEIGTKNGRKLDVSRKYACIAAKESRQSNLLDRCWARPIAQRVALVRRHMIGGRPSRVILTTVRQRIVCRTGRVDHASR